MIRSSSSSENLAQLAIEQPYSHVELKPVNLEFEHNGKTYSITFVKQKVGGEKGEEKNLDLTKLKPDEMVALVAQAKKAMDAMRTLDGADAFKNSKSFTLHFTTQKKEPTFLNRMLGHKFKRFEPKPNPTVFDSITYKEGSEDKKFAVNLSKYEENAQKKIQKNLLPLSTMIDKLFIKSAQVEKPLKLGKHKAETAIAKNPPAQSDDASDAVTGQTEYKSYSEEIESEEEDLEFAALKEELLSTKPNKKSSYAASSSNASSNDDPGVADLQARLDRLRK